MQNTLEEPKNVITPNKNSSISKALLTPCRRIGLSRKISSHKSKSSSKTFTTSVLKHNSFNTTSKSLKEEKDLNELHDKHEDFMCNAESVTNNGTIKLKDQYVKKPIKTNCEKYNKKTQVNKISELMPKIVLYDILSNKDEQQVIKNNSIWTADRSTDRSSNSSQESSSFSQRGQDKKTVTKKLSIKKASSSCLKYMQSENISDEEIMGVQNSNCFIESKQLNTNNSADNLDTICGHSQEKENVQVKKFNKRKQILYSSDEDDFIPLQNVSKKSTTFEPDLKKMINESKKRIQQKQDHLNRLNQASVYKKLHNIEELQQLTKIWRNGCENGLRHLLTKLQEHAEINMPSLLLNLKIPSDIINYNADEDIFYN